ncbi:ABC1 [Scenedesmus sp. PABB004]|nr:ABC1 [Scenedesmus sp. PABB004]
MQRLAALPRLAAAARGAAAAAARQQSAVAAGGAAAAAAGPAGASKLALGAKYLAGAGAAAWASQSDGAWEAARLAYLIPTRLARDVAAAASIVMDYKSSLAGLPEGDAEARDAALRACHQRSADRLLKLCFDNGGIYIKLGQHIGQLDHLLPEEYVHTMRAHMLDKCPVSSWEEVRQTIREDLGAPPEELFASFSPTPIASASLAQARRGAARGSSASARPARRAPAGAEPPPGAPPRPAPPPQVHVAHTHDGRKLAVKVQHAGLRESCAADVATIEALVSAARLAFPDFNYQWLVDEVRTNLPLELDFRHEASNAARCAANLASPRSTVGGRVHVPEVLPGLSAARVLSMEYIDGVQVTDRGGLSRLGVSPRALASLVSQTFAEMIFIHGDVHCDPHAANMLVRRGPGGGVQLVLLDHGLYRQIDDAFRHEYAALWRSLILADRAGIKAHAESMNAGDAYPLFAAMLTMRPWDQIVEPQLQHLAVGRGAEERAMMQGYAAIYAKQIGDLLLRMPRPLLLLLKTNDCLRSVDLCLGAPVNTFVITAKTCARALAEPGGGAGGGGPGAGGAGAWLAGALGRARLELAMAAMRAAGAWAALRSALRLGGGAGGGRAGGLGAGGVVYDEALLSAHRAAAEAGVVLSAQQEAASAAAAAA